IATARSTAWTARRWKRPMPSSSSPPAASTRRWCSRCTRAPRTCRTKSCGITALSTSSAGPRTGAAPSITATFMIRCRSTPRTEEAAMDGDTRGWPKEGNSRVPYRMFSDPEVYRAELERVFLGPTWQFLVLADELPNPGDYKTTFLGETPVIVTRGDD